MDLYCFVFWKKYLRIFVVLYLGQNIYDSILFCIWISAVFMDFSWCCMIDVLVEDDGPGGKKAAFGTSSKPTGAFQFSAGSSASSTAAAPSGAAFTFSAGTTSIAPTATTASTAGTAAGVFSFGQSTPAASTVQPFGTAASTTAAATTTTTPAG